MAFGFLRRKKKTKGSTGSAPKKRYVVSVMYKARRLGVRAHTHHEVEADGAREAVALAISRSGHPPHKVQIRGVKQVSEDVKRRAAAHRRVDSYVLAQGEAMSHADPAKRRDLLKKIRRNLKRARVRALGEALELKWNRTGSPTANRMMDTLRTHLLSQHLDVAHEHLKNVGRKVSRGKPPPDGDAFDHSSVVSDLRGWHAEIKRARGVK